MRYPEHVIIAHNNQTFFEANTYLIVPDAPAAAADTAALAGSDAATAAGDAASSSTPSRNGHDSRDEADRRAGEKVALLVDPGAGAAAWVPQELAKLGAQLGAVLLTHGHADHVWDAAAIADNPELSVGEPVPVYVPEPDLYRLADPLASLGIPGVALGFQRMGANRQWVTPSALQALPTAIYSQAIELVPGLPVRAVAAPGHTEGSSVFLFAGAAQGEFAAPENAATPVRTFMLAGDVIFKGSVGRTDLPGGDQREMEASLRFLVNVIKPDVTILPGHGPATTVWDETRTNPYLHAAMS